MVEAKYLVPSKFIARGIYNSKFDILKALNGG